jgi:hypothetical protein
MRRAASLLCAALCLAASCRGGPGPADGRPDPGPAPGPAVPQEPCDDPIPAPEEDSRHLSSWGRLVLARTALAAQGAIVRLFRLQGGVSVATFRIDEVLHGRGEKGKTVLVVSPDPAFFKGGEACLLFLAREADGDRFEALDRVDSSGAEGAVRVEAVRRYVAMEALDDPEEKRKEFKRILFANLSSPEPWCRDNAVRELYIFTEREPGAFAPEDLETLRREALAARKASTRHPLLYSVSHLEVLPPLSAAAGRDPAAAEAGMKRLRALVSEVGVPAETIQFREDVVFQLYRASRDPAVRAGVVRAAAELGRPRLSVGVLKALYDASRRVRLEALKGLRLCGSPRFAAAVARRLADPFPEVRREAALTLALLGTEAEVEALEDLADREAETPEVREAARAAVQAIEGR